MSLYERVPPIDLSPAYSDPPYAPFVVRDYLRLLGDLFYFPQSVRDYVRSYARAVRSENSPPQTRALAAWNSWLRENPVQVDFLLMVALLGLLLILVLINGVGLLAGALAREMPPLGAMGWAMLIASVSLLIMLAIGAAGDEAGALASFALPVALAIGLAWLACAAAVSLGVVDGFAGMALIATTAALAFGVAAAALFATASVGANNLWTHAALAAIIATLLAVAIGLFGWPAAESAQSAAALLGRLLALGLLAAVGYLVGALRLDDYLLHARYPGTAPAPADWLAIARVTPLPLPYLHEHMTAWLDFEWQQGMDNCVSLWWFTGQQAAVRSAMHEILRGDHPAPAVPDASIKLDAQAARQAERTLAMVAHAADFPQRYPWGMISYAPTTPRDLLNASLAAMPRQERRRRLPVGAASPQATAAAPGRCATPPCAPLAHRRTRKSAGRGLLES